MNSLAIISAMLAALYMSLAVAKTSGAPARGREPSAAHSTDVVDEDFSDLFAHAKPYAYLRARLLRHGWKPLIVNKKMADGTRERDDVGAGDMLEAGLIEVEWCTGVDIDGCTFNFKKGSFCLKVNTVGEYSKKHKMPVIYSEIMRRCNKKIRK